MSFLDQAPACPSVNRKFLSLHPYYLILFPMAFPQGISQFKKKLSSQSQTPSPSGSGNVGGWTGLRALLEVLKRSTGGVSPLKNIVDELVECVEIYDVSMLVSFQMAP